MKLSRIFLSLVIVLTLFFHVSGQSGRLVIMHTNDTHSQIDPYSYKKDVDVGGFLRREAAIREIREQNPNNLLFDAGDFSQGTPYFNVFKGYVEIKLMNDMHYDAATLGNHEFDNGSLELAKRLKKAKFPVVCANYRFSEPKLAEVVKPYVVFERDSLKIGVFGLCVDLNSYVAPQIAAEVTYLDPVECAKKAVAELQELNCDLIICLSHLGVNVNVKDNDYEIARQVPEIDVIIGGHSHEEMPQPKIVGKTRICQMTNRGKCFGVMTIEKIK